MTNAANLRLTTTTARPGNRPASSAGILSLFSLLALASAGCEPTNGLEVQQQGADGSVPLSLGSGDGGVDTGTVVDSGTGTVVDSGTGTVVDSGTGTGGGGGGGSTTVVSPILRTSGRYLLDRCGNRLVIRGVENFLGNQLPQGNDWAGLIDHIGATGSNAVRVIPTISFLSTADVDAVLTRVEANGMVAFISPTDRTWFGRPDVKAMLDTHEGSLIVDAFQEPNYDNRTQWVVDASAAIAQVRGYGYRVPITVLANQYGRDLPVLLSHGAEVVANDPQHNIILGWQAYWGSGGWYQGFYGMTVVEGIAAIGNAAFPIQIGLDEYTDGTETLDYGAAMTAAETHDVGWLWWDWYNPYGNQNSMTSDGTMAGLNARGTNIVRSHPAGIQNTSVKACRPQQ